MMGDELFGFLFGIECISQRWSDQAEINGYLGDRIVFSQAL